MPADTELTAYRCLFGVRFLFSSGCSPVKVETDMKPKKTPLNKRRSALRAFGESSIGAQNKQILKRCKGGVYKRK